MNQDDSYELWKRSRASSSVPEGFADRVMSGVREVEGGRRRSFLSVCVAAISASRAGRYALVLVAVLFCALRISGPLLLLMTAE